MNNDDTQPTGTIDPIKPPARPNPLKRLSIPLIIIAITSAGAVIGLLLVVNNLQSSPNPPLSVTLFIDGETREVNTTAATVGALLNKQGVAIAPDDNLSPEVETPLSDGLRIIIERARPVHIIVDDDETTIRTTHESPFDILRQAEIEIGDYDIVRLDGQAVSAANLLFWPLPVQAIAITRALPVTIIDGDETIMLNTTGATVGDALFEAGVELFVTDTVQPNVNTPITVDLAITIDRSRSIRIIADDETVETRVNAQTVGGALNEAGLSLQGLDYSIPDEANELVPDSTIRVIRVTESIDTYEEILPYETIYQGDDSMRLDTRATLQAGQNGLYRRTERIRYENGIEISRDVEDEGVVENPQNAIIAYGTNIQIRTLDTPDGPVEYWRHLRMYATSYHPGSVGGSTTTSIGETLRKGIIAIDPRIVNYRTNMYVPGYGQGIAADTGGPRRSPYWVDLGYSDDDWVGWSRWVDVYLLTPVPDNVRYLLPASGNQGGPVGN